MELSDLKRTSRLEPETSPIPIPILTEPDIIVDRIAIALAEIDRPLNTKEKCHG
jgi:hypothetical protein